MTVSDVLYVCDNRGTDYPSIKLSVIRNTFLKGLIMNDTDSGSIM